MNPPMIAKPNAPGWPTNLTLRHDRWASFSDFVSNTYQSSVEQVFDLGRSGAKLIYAAALMGENPVSPTPDLTVAMARTSMYEGYCDIGAGRFRATVHRRHWTLLPPNTAVGVWVDRPYALTMMAIPYAALLDLAGDDAGLPPDGDMGRLHARINTERAVARLITALSYSMANEEAHSSLYFDGAILQLADMLIQLSTGSSSDPAERMVDDRRVRIAMEYLRSDLSVDVPLADVAAQVGLSGSRLRKLFIASTGETPHRWLMRQRFKRACELLGDQRLTVTSIAHTCGFASSQHMATVFSKRIAMSPTAYRDMQLR